MNAKSKTLNVHMSYDEAINDIVEAFAKDKKALKAALIQYDMLVKQNSGDMYKDCDLPFWCYGFNNNG